MNWKKFIFLALMATVPSFVDLTEEISEECDHIEFIESEDVYRFYVSLDFLYWTTQNQGFSYAFDLLTNAISINANGQGPFLAVTNQNYIMLTSNQSSMPGISVETTTTEVTFISAANMIYTGPGSPYRFDCSGASGVIVANLQANVMGSDEVDASEPAIAFNGNAGLIGANITNCQLVSTTTPELLAVTQPNATICWGGHDNNFHGLNLDNSAGGTIYLEQLFDLSEEFSVRGNVTYVPEGFYT